LTVAPANQSTQISVHTNAFAHYSSLYQKENNDDSSARSPSSPRADADMTAPWTALVLMREHRVGNWIDEAACSGADPDLFFPTKGEPAQEAKALCAGCPVRKACKDYAESSPIMLAGVWGGTTERERAYGPIDTTRRGTPFLDRFLELRELGYNDLRIVNRLGLKPESLLRQMQRHGIKASPDLVQEAWKTKRNHYIKGEQ